MHKRERERKRDATAVNGTSEEAAEPDEDPSPPPPPPPDFLSAQQKAEREKAKAVRKTKRNSFCPCASVIRTLLCQDNSTRHVQCVFDRKHQNEGYILFLGTEHA